MPLTLEELAIHIPGAIAVFEEYDLDYYQNGSRTLRSACAEKRLSYKEVDDRLSGLSDRSGIILPLTLADMSADRLIDYINGSFHSSEEEQLHFLHQQLFLHHYTSGEQRRVGQTEPHFALLKEHLLDHCRKEDELLFPWMRKLVLLHKTRSLKKDARSVTLIHNPLLLLREEHATITGLLQTVKRAADHFTVPETASEPYRALMQRFKDFEAAFHMHLHIENNILFPKLIAMEQSLTHP
jgi:regulator of cell morphogenesis and NO signaling